MSCKPTYEGLKFLSPPLLFSGLFSCKPTYEGLKSSARLAGSSRPWVLQAYL